MEETPGGSESQIFFASRPTLLVVVWCITCIFLLLFCFGPYYLLRISRRVAVGHERPFPYELAERTATTSRPVNTVVERWITVLNYLWSLVTTLLTASVPLRMFKTGDIIGDIKPINRRPLEFITPS